MGPNQAVRIGWVVCCFARPCPRGRWSTSSRGWETPGKEYEGSRHNAGFMGMEALADRLHVKIDRVKFKSYCGQADIGGRRTLLLMPQTFMNLSGEAVREAMQFYKIPPERTVILFDDISLPVGTVRVRRKGSDGGQRGMKSIIYLTGSDQFPRVKIGVGAKPHPDYDLAAWVLSKFTKEEAPRIREAADHAGTGRLPDCRGPNRRGDEPVFQVTADRKQGGGAASV